MKLQNGNSSDAYLRQAFTWLTRIGAGPHFGSRPIGWYQMHQMAALNILESSAPNCELRCKAGQIQGRVTGGKWHNLMTASGLFSMADDKCRQ